MCEAQIYIENIKKTEQITLRGGGCHLPTGGSLPPLGGCKNITGYESEVKILFCLWNLSFSLSPGFGFIFCHTNEVFRLSDIIAGLSNVKRNRLPVRSLRTFDNVRK